jgi:hypothetical protein
MFSIIIDNVGSYEEAKEIIELLPTKGYECREVKGSTYTCVRHSSSCRPEILIVYVVPQSILEKLSTTVVGD